MLLLLIAKEHSDQAAECNSSYVATHRSSAASRCGET